MYKSVVLGLVLMNLILSSTEVWKTLPGHEGIPQIPFFTLPKWTEEPIHTSLMVSHLFESYTLNLLYTLNVKGTGLYSQVCVLI